MSSSYREGIWDSIAVGNIAGWIRDIEEEGLAPGGWVPEESRAFLTSMNIDLFHRRANVWATQRTLKGLVYREKLLTW